MTIYEDIIEIIYINLDNAVKRKIRINNMIRQFFPDKLITRFTAVNRDTIYDKENLIIWQDRIQRQFRINNDQSQEFDKKNSGIIGCYMSHYNILKYINDKYHKDDDNDNDNDHIILILEDDCIINNDTIMMLKSEEFNNNLPKDWAVLRPISQQCDEKDRINDLFYNSSISKQTHYKYYMGTFFNIINTKNMKTYINKLDKLAVGNYDVISRKVSDTYYFKCDNITSDNYDGSERIPLHE